MITLRESPNLFKNPDGIARIVEEFSPGNVVADYLPKDFKVEGNYVALNGRGLSDEEVFTLRPKPGDEIHCARVPGIIAALFATAAATSAAGAFAASAVGAIIIAVADAAITFAISYGISFGINALTARDRVRQKDEEGPSRSFEGIQDTAGAGNPIPFIYGKVRCGGQFIQSFEKNLTGEEQRAGITTLFTRIAWCQGPVRSCGFYEINGNKLGDIPGLTTETRLGTPDQEALPGFDEVNTETVLESPLPRNEPPIPPATTPTEVIKTYNTVKEVDAFSVVFRFRSGLVKIKPTSGTRRNYTVKISVKWRLIAGPGVVPNFTEIIVDCTASSTAPVKRVFKVPNLPKGRYEIVVQRLTVDDDEIGIQGQFNSSSELYAVIETENVEQAHPGFVNTGFSEVPSDLINGPVPTTYTALIEGFNNVRIYTDETTYTIGYTQNPAWCCAHFLTEKHGAGDRYTWANINIPSFLRWAARCDELVPDGRGGSEPRSLLGHVFDEFRDFKATLQLFQQGAEANLVFRGNEWWAEVDEPDEMVWIATTANVAAGTFNLGFTPKKERANRVTALFVNQDRNYTRDTLPRELLNLPQGTFFVEANRELFGTTRPSQIVRLITRFLLRTKLEVQTIELDAGLDSLRVTVGRIFGVSLVTGGIGVATGKILKVNDFQTAFRLDEEVKIEAGKIYEVQVQHKINSAISRKRITNPPGTYLELSPEDAAWNGTLQEGDTYALGEVDASVVKFRCINVSTDAAFNRRIVGIRYDERVYTDDLTLEPSPIKVSLPNPYKAPPPVTDLIVAERREVQPDGVITQIIDVDWNSPVSANLDRIRVWKAEADPAAAAAEGVSLVETLTPWELVADNIRGDYYFFPLREEAGFCLFVAVETLTKTGVSLGIAGSPQASIILTGDVFQPPDPVAVSATIIDGTLVAVVTISDAEIPLGLQKVGFEWRIGTSWTSSVFLERTTIPRLETKSYPRGAVNLLVKTYTAGGNYSKNAASILITLYGQVEENIVLIQEEGPGWTGMREGLKQTGLYLELAEPIVSMVPASEKDTAAILLGGFGPLTMGFPEPSQKIVLEGVYTLDPIQVISGLDGAIISRPDVRVAFTAISIDLGTFEEADFAFDDARAEVPFEGEEANNVTFVVESRFSTTDLVDSSFSPWVIHRDRSEYLAKYIQFRVRIQVLSDAYTAQLDQVTVTIDLPDKVQSGVSQVLSAVSGEVEYPLDFFLVVKRLLVTQIGGAAGDTQRVYNETAAGFTYELRDSANALKPGTINYEARGY